MKPIQKIAIFFLAFSIMGAGYFSDLSPIEVEDLADGTDGELYTWGTDGTSETLGAGTDGFALFSRGAGSTPIFKRVAPMVIVVDEKAQGVAGGTFTSVVWQTRDLNTLTQNDDTIGSLSSNQITLPTGTYECWISAPAFDVNQHMIRLRDTTAAANIETGTSEFMDVAANIQTRSFLYAKFVLSESSALEVQHRCISTKTSNGFGVFSNFPSIVETYTVAVFRKVE